jgi:hypothetical protein
MKLTIAQKVFLGVVLAAMLMLNIIGQVQAWTPSFRVRTEQYPMGSLLTMQYRTIIEDRFNNVFAEIVHEWTPCGEKVSQSLGTVLSSVDGSRIGTFSAYTIRENEIYLRINLIGGRTIIYSITKTLAGDVYYNNTTYMNSRLVRIKTEVMGLYCYCPTSTGQYSDSKLVGP